jgi:hypothetical protein
MRKITTIFTLFLLAGSLAAAADKKFTIRLTACLLRPADANYRDIYAQSVFLPRLELAYNFPIGLSLWAAYGWVKKNGQGQLSDIACSSLQQLVAAGPAYSMAVSKSVALRLAAGPLLVFYREKAGLWTVSGNTLGADINAAVAWKFSCHLALEGRLGYLLARDSIDGGEKFKLGGMWGGLGLAVYF